MSENEPSQEQPYEAPRRVRSKLGELAVLSGNTVLSIGAVVGVTDLLGEPLSLPVATAVAVGANTSVYLSRKRS